MHDNTQTGFVTMYQVDRFCRLSTMGQRILTMERHLGSEERLCPFPLTPQTIRVWKRVLFHLYADEIRHYPLSKQVSLFWVKRCLP